MKRSLALITLLALGGPGVALAADHTDGSAVTADPTTDITDLFTWMSSDGSKVYLVMDVFPVATTTSKFSNAAKYVFHIASYPGLMMPAAGQTNVICTFSDGTATTAACWIVDAKASTTTDYVAGDASATAGLVSTSGKVKLFAGLRDDPFFFNLDGFKKAASTVHTLATTPGALTLDTNGCPMLDAATQAAAVGLLKSDGMGGAPKDHFAGKNVMAIVIAIDKAELTSGSNALLSVWASTNK